MIRVRLVADDVDELHAAAAAVGHALTITKQSQPVGRRSGKGVSLYLETDLYLETKLPPKNDILGKANGAISE